MKIIYPVHNAKITTLKLSTFLLLLLINCTTYAQPGSLDFSFGTGGKVATIFNSPKAFARAVVIQTDGKIVVGGYEEDLNDYDFALARYNNDGSLDSTFGGDGKVTTDFDGKDDYILSMALQEDGKIIAAGYLYDGTTYIFGLARYNSNGSLDESFDEDGRVTTDVLSGFDFGWFVTIQNDGKILMAGSSDNGTNFEFSLVRYNTDGSLDNSFDDDGIVTVTIGSLDNRAYSIALQEDGKILIAGSSKGAGNYKFAVIRYNEDGSLDTTFNSDGIVTTDFGVGVATPYSVGIQEDGRIVLAGFAQAGTGRDLALARYNTDGSLDNTFDGDGILTTNIGPNSDYSYALLFQNDGKILVTGESSNGSNSDIALVRYNVDGSLDGSFGNSGIVTTAFGPDNDAAHSIAIQEDGKIVLAGYSGSGVEYEFAVLRYFSCIGSSADITQTACGSIVINNIPYDVSGTYIQHLTNSLGCDSTLTLNLIINPLPLVTLDLESIDTLLVSDNDVTLSGGSPSGGIYSGAGVTGNTFSPSLTGAGTFEIRYTYTDGNLCSNSAIANIYVDGNVGTVSPDISDQINIYPNPNHGIFVVRSEFKFSKIAVINAMGEKLYEQNVDSKKTEGFIDLSNLSHGIYFLCLKSENKIQAKKIIVN